MTYRPPTRDRWMRPMGVGMLLWFVFLSGREYLNIPSVTPQGALQIGERHQDVLLAMVLTLGLSTAVVMLAVAVASSIRVWRSRVVVNDQGVRWNVGQGPDRFLRWAEILGLDYDRRARRLTIGFRDRTRGNFHPLPFVTRDLYLAVRERAGAVPDVDVERRCLAR